ncbi:hypothetical protein OO011_09025, partial [Cocleimonas sp. KMM 6896]
MPLNTQVSPGATVKQLIVFGVILLSVTTTLVKVAVPLFVAVMVYVKVSPSLISPLPSSSALSGAGLT